MSSDPTSFDAVTEALSTRGVEGALAQLIIELDRSGSLHELFDARLMQARHRLGLALMSSVPIDDLPENVRDPLEAAYLEACREVGGKFLEQGLVREAWMYLRPVGDKKSVGAALRRIEPTDEQVEAIVEVALHEAVDPELGFQLVLDRYGTCNAISLFDGIAPRLPRGEPEKLAARLVRRLHDELSANLAADIERRGAEHGLTAEAVAKRGGQRDDSGSIAQLIEGRDWLLADDNYHIDTSHLSAVIRMARLVTDPEVLALAIDLTEYGRRLSPQYQYPGEAPFEELYLRSRQFFRAQCGLEVDTALEYFAQRARAADTSVQGTAAAEVYIALLARLQRFGEAISAAAELLPAGAPQSGFAPSLMELSRSAGDYGALVEQSRRQGNLLTFAAGLLETARDPAR
jgi:hypothetical protein